MLYEVITGIVVRHGFLERRDRLMDRARRDEDLRGCAPDDDQPIALVLRLEVSHVLAKRLSQIPLGLSFSYNFV